MAVEPQSRNDLGTIGADGRLRNNDTGEVIAGVSDATREAVLESLERKVRHAPSERDAYFANGGVLKAEPYQPEDSQPSGHIDDLKDDKADGKETPSKGAPSKDNKK